MPSTTTASWRHRLRHSSSISSSRRNSSNTIIKIAGLTDRSATRRIHSSSRAKALPPSPWPKVPVRARKRAKRRTPRNRQCHEGSRYRLSLSVVADGRETALARCAGGFGPFRARRNNSEAPSSWPDSVRPSIALASASVSQIFRRAYAHRMDGRLGAAHDGSGRRGRISGGSTSLVEFSVRITFPSGALWKHAGFMRLWAAQTVSSFGARITREGLALASVLTINAKPLQLGILAALALGPSVIVG